MQRDWPLFAAGLGIVVLSAAVAVPAILAYRPADDAPCDPPKPPAVMIDGCYRERGGFDVWISQPGVVVTLAVAFVLLLIAVATMRRGSASRAGG